MSSDAPGRGISAPSVVAGCQGRLPHAGEGTNPVLFYLLIFNMIRILPFFTVPHNPSAAIYPECVCVRERASEKYGERTNKLHFYSEIILDLRISELQPVLSGV